MTCLATAIRADTTASIAALVNETDASRLATSLSAAIDSPDALMRMTAARVVTVRGVSELLPKLRDHLAREKDTDAAREEVRTLVILGDRSEVDAAIAATRSLP